MKNNLNFGNLDQVCKKLKIKKGDNLYLSLDTFKVFSFISKQLKKNEFESSSLKFLKYLKKKVGPDGNLIIPVFSYNISKSKYFDRSKTKSDVGLIGNYILKKYYENRTFNPFYSFLIFGKHKKKLLQYTNLGATELNSPWQFMIKKNYKIFSLGIHYARSLTINHYFEQINNVNYRFIKYFYIDYLDFGKRKSKKMKFNFYVRKKYCNFSGITSRCEKIFLRKKVAVKYKHNKFTSYLLDLKKASIILLNDIKLSKNNLIYFRGKNFNPKKVLNKDDFYDLEYGKIK